MAFDTAIRELTSRLARRPGFRGTAIFAFGQPFGAPLEVAIEGRVVDAAGRAISGARVRTAGQSAWTNRCGLFAIRGVPPPAATLAVDAPGFAPVSITASGLVPGRQRTLAPVVLASGS
jgi:hypothetical protein